MLRVDVHFLSFVILQMTEDDGLPAHICNKCVVHVSKSFAFKQLCVKSDEELRKDLQLSRSEPQPTDDQVYIVKSDRQPTEVALTEEATILDEDRYTYHLVEEYEDEERIIDDDGEEYREEKNVQIILKVERRDDMGMDDDEGNGSAVEQYNIELSEVEEEAAVAATVDDQEIVQEEEVFEYEVENEEADQTAKGDSDDELVVIPKMVFRKYNKRNKKMPAPPYVCAVCSKMLSNYSSYKYHMQLHSDKKVRAASNTWSAVLQLGVNFRYSLSCAATVASRSRREMHTMDTSSHTTKMRCTNVTSAKNLIVRRLVLGVTCYHTRAK